MSSSRRRQVPTEGSWRLVDGENESFDMRYVSSFDEDHISMPPSGSSQPFSSHPSQQSFSASQGGMSFASQDSIRDFNNYQDDEQVILREPFRPTMPPSIASGSTTMSLNHGSDLQLRMPRVDIDTDLTSSGRTSTEMPRPWKWKQSIHEEQDSEDESEHRYPLRKRRKSNQEQRMGGGGTKKRERNATKSTTAKRQSPKSAPQSSNAFPGRALGILRLLFYYLTIPILLASTSYILYSSGMTGISLESLSFPIYLNSITPSCPISSDSQISPPFCESESHDSRNSVACNVNFKNLIETQGKFDEILRKGHRGSSMPLDLEGSEITTRNLRSLLKDSDLPRKDELLPELNSYIENVGRAGPDLQAFFIHIGSTVDSIISVNRWTLRHMSSLSVEPESPKLPLFAWASRLLDPFRSSQSDLHDRILLEKYTEHIVLVQDRLERLTDEGSTLALLLSHSQNHLNEISNLSKQSSPSPTPSKSASLLASIWSLIGGRMEDEQREQREQLDSLEKIVAQFTSVISYVFEIIEAIKDIQAELEDLLRKSAGSTGARTDEGASTAQSTLNEQIDIVKNGLRGLEDAKKRNTENHQHQETSP